MNRQSSLPALEKASTSKTEYRILRAKVLKVLDHHFKKDQNTKRLQDDNENSEYGIQKPAKIKTLDLLRMIKNHDTSALSRTLNETIIEDSKGAILNGHAGSMSENQELTVKNLCKFITAEELELICEDPIYFLGRKEYQRNPKLTDYQEWGRQLELAKEKKKKERYWKETQEAAKVNGSQSPRNQYFERLSHSNNCTISIIEDKDRTKLKKLQMEDHVRYLKEKNNEMQYMAKMRRLEDEDYKEHMLNEWKTLNLRKSDSVERRLNDRQNKIKRLIFESQQGRDLAQKKLSKWREEKANVQELNKINFEIENIIKQKIVEKHKNQEISSKIERAKISKTLRSNKHSEVGKSFASNNMLSKDTTFEDINTSRGL